MDNVLKMFTIEELKEFLLFHALKVKLNCSFTDGQLIEKYINLKLGNKLKNISKYFINKLLDAFSSCASIHYICNICNRYLGEKSEIISKSENNMFKCKCGENKTVDSIFEGMFFFVFISSLSIRTYIFTIR